MGSPRCTSLLGAFLLALSAGAGRAQTPDTLPPAHLAYVDGTAWLEREADRDPATAGMPLLPGDRLSTERGRVEIVFPDGTALDVDQYAIVELSSDQLLRLTRGRIVLMVMRTTAARGGFYAIDTPVASIETDGPGEYRVSILSGSSAPETALAVVRGSAALVNDAGTMQLRAGERSIAGENTPPAAPESFNSARADAFYQWSQSRRDDRYATTSRDHLPDDLRPYAGDLERNGNWQYDTSDGYVWYPNVAPDWQPYSDGYWSPLPTYGWTWVGVSAWAWPTHHYGRWGYSGARWYWIPDRRWSPGWVSWGVSTGYVSWCPLGFDNRPVFALTSTHAGPWRGWTVVPHDRFVRGHQPVRQYALKPGTIPDRTAFITSSRAPVLPPRVATRQIVGAPGAARPDWNNRHDASGRAQRTVPRTNDRSADRQAVPRTVMPPPSTVMRPPTTMTPPPATVQSPPTTVQPPPTTVLPPQRTALPPARTAFPPERTTASPRARTTFPPARTALPPSTTAAPPATTALPPPTTALPPATTPDRGPRSAQPRTGAEDRRRGERQQYAPRESSERATAPSPRQPPRAEPPRAEQPRAAQPERDRPTRQAPPSGGSGDGGRRAQPRESHGEGKGATAGTAAPRGGESGRSRR